MSERFWFGDCWLVFVEVRVGGVKYNNFYKVDLG